MPDRVLYLRDHTLAFKNLLQMVFDSYSNGSLPVFNRWMGGGEYLLGDWNALPTSPFLLVGLLHGDIDLWYDYFVVAHLPAAALGAFLLVRELKLSQRAAFISATSFCLSGTFLSWNNLLPAFESVSFAPYVLFFALRLVKSPTVGGVILLSVFGVFHGQTADPVFIYWDAFLFVCCWHYVHSHDDSPTKLSLSSRHGLLALVAAIVLACGLAAIHLAPLSDILYSSIERGAGFSQKVRDTWSLESWRLVELLVPRSQDSIGSALVTTKGKTYIAYISHIYFGPVVCALIFASLFDTRRSWLFFAAALLSIACALDVDSFFTSVSAKLPLLSSSRYPVKNIYGITMAGPILAGIGVDWLSSSKKVHTAYWAVLTAIASSILVIEASEQTTQTAGVLHLAGLLSLALWVRNQEWKISFLLLQSLVSVDLAWWGLPLLGTSSIADVQPPLVETILDSSKEEGTGLMMVHSVRPGPKESRWLLSWHRGLGSASRTRLRHFTDIDLASRRGILFRTLFTYLNAIQGDDRANAFRRIGVEYISGFGMEYRDYTFAGGINYGVGQSKGLVSAYMKTESHRRLISIQVPEGCLRLDCLTRDPPPTAGSVSRLEVTQNAYIADLTAYTAAEVVITHLFHPAWKVKIDGVPARGYPIDGVLVGVKVPPGKHVVRFAFEPHSTRRGVFVTFTSIVVSIAVLAFVSVSRIDRGSMSGCNPQHSSQFRTSANATNKILFWANKLHRAQYGTKCAFRRVPDAE